MKIQAVGALAVLANSATANWQKINDLFLQLEEAAYNKTIADDPTAANDRGFVPFVQNLLLDIQFYGCWCYLDDSWDTAKGPVQDGLDQECKNLVQNYRCLVLDALDRGETCDPQNQDYTEYNLFGGSEQLISECRTNANLGAENEQCRMDLCIADGQFTLNMFALMFQQGGIAASQPPYDPNVAHSTNTENPGEFDPAIECLTNGLQGAGRSEKECCGSYPERFPFKTFGGDKGCCAERTYSTLALQCCIGESEQLLDINDPCP